VNHAVLALTTATIVMLMGRRVLGGVPRKSAALLLDNLASLPLVFPGLVLGLSIMICLSLSRHRVYGTVWSLLPSSVDCSHFRLPAELTLAPILLIAYVTRFLPYGSRYVSTSMLQIHKELEESAAMSGASWAMTFRRSSCRCSSGFAGRLHLRDDRLDRRTVEFDPALQPRAKCVGDDLGVVQNGQYVELSHSFMLIVPVLPVMIAQLSQAIRISEA